MNINFIDLKKQYGVIEEPVQARLKKVLERGDYIMGKEVFELEGALQKFTGVKHAITCANGTDSLQMALLALQLPADSVVIVPSFTFAATAEVVLLLGYKLAFVDVDPSTFNICPQSLERTIQHLLTKNEAPSALIAVDLFGLPADYANLAPIVDRHSLKLICDSAQAFGATFENGRQCVSAGDIASTSFFPAKPLGCYGDGGALFTDSDELADLLKSIRVHGKGECKYENVRVGMNSRLDTLQAAVLIEKLKIYPKEIELRNKVAQSYASKLSQANSLALPLLGADENVKPVWAQYTLKLSDGVDRTKLQSYLKEQGIPTAVYYPAPLSNQKAFQKAFRDPEGLANSERLSKVVLSLPMHPYLTEDEISQICEHIVGYFDV